MEAIDSRPERTESLTLLETTLERPESLEVLPNVIHDIQHTLFNLDQLRDVYKEKIGLSRSKHSDHYFHPRALENELNDIKDNHHNLKSNYMNTATREKFLEYMVQEPRLEITPEDLNTLGRENEELAAHIESLEAKRDRLEADMKTTVQHIESGKLRLMDTIIDTEGYIQQTLTMENRIQRIRDKIKDKEDFTVEEANETIAQLSDEMTKRDKSIEDMKEQIYDTQWTIRQKEKKVQDKKRSAIQLEREANAAKRAKSAQNEFTDIQYKEYKEALESYNHILYGVKTIDYSSQDVIHVTFEEKYHNAVLHIYVDYEKKRVDHATIDGPAIDLKTVVKLVKSTSVNAGVRIVILETLDRIKKLI